MAERKVAALWLAALALLAWAAGAPARCGDKVELKKTGESWSVQVAGKPFFVKGVTWSHTPVGHKYDYDLYALPEAQVQAAIDRDMTLLKAAGCNALRALPPRRWAQYIHEKYGMRFILNEYCGRYGMMVKGAWVAQTNYADPETRRLIIENWKKLAKESRDVPGLLAYALGNENNYGLEWKSAEIENLPTGERHAAKARYLYSLFNEIAREVKKIDPDHPVGIVNGDVQYIDLIAKECPDVDFFGCNVYRGYDYTDLYDTVKKKLGRPVLLTETGCDAFNAVTKQEDQKAQAEYVYRNWADIYRNAAANGGAGNAIGGLQFEWADEWWKLGQSVNLNTHDTTASWSNGAFQYDIKAGNNMNEEWFGICSIREEEKDGAHLVTPRAAYFALKDVWAIDPYTAGAAKIKAMKFDAAPYLAAAEKAAAKTAEDLKTAKAPAAGDAPKVGLPAAVYRDNGDKEPWVPSGYMGDTGAIAMDPGCADNPHSGKTCLKVVYSKGGGWGGVMWQDPANDWGDQAGGKNLTGAKKLTFWARSKVGGEKVKFGAGGLGRDKKFHDTFKVEGSFALTKEWKQYSFDLGGKDLSRVKTGFMWVVAGQGVPVEFYLDDIVYE